MKIFKSKEERRIERDMQIRKTLGQFARQIKTLSKNEQSYLQSAKEAKKLGASAQLELARKALRHTIIQRKRLEQQYLTLKIAADMKNQADSLAQFANAMTAVSRTIAEVFGSVDLVKTQKDFEMSMAQARSMEERIDIFLESSSESMLSEPSDAEDVISDEELDRLIESEAAHEEGKLDDEIDRGLKEIEKELAKGGK